MAKRTATIYYAGFIRWGGVLCHVRSLKNELERVGWTVKVVTLDSLPFWCRYAPHLVAGLVDLVASPLGVLYKDRLTGFLYRYLFDTKVDVRVFEDIYISWNSDVPSVTILHAVWSDNLQAYPATARRRQELMRREARIIDSIRHPIATVSGPYLEHIRDAHFAGGLSKRIEVIESGIDHSPFKGARNAGGKSIVYVGALEARKNVAFLLEVFKKVTAADSAYALTIVGDGPQRSMLAAYAKNNGLAVDFRGALSPHEIPGELKRHGIYLHTSVKESFSYALLEAKLAGLKTCAHAKLQVPRGFIDAPIDSFEADEWRDGILNIESAGAAFNADDFTVETMTQRILGLAK